MSVGNQTQAVDFDKEHLTLVLGENLDLGGDDTGARNGTGKTTIVNALSYALYGQALTNIKKENLINKINGKGMLVSVEFLKDNIKYRIERGRKPNVLKLYINDQEQQDDFEQWPAWLLGFEHRTGHHADQPRRDRQDHTGHV